MMGYFAIAQRLSWSIALARNHQTQLQVVLNLPLLIRKYCHKAIDANNLNYRFP
ncbi:MAG: hypothetical protein HC903_25675 [Methylacidiphilales bacterium]|nr:hypothetical protein [Candidatus Methylacidiphilales bacterium]NJR14748.1 hypothetical protein [Calothrix sp. CSU_2_0]